MFLSVYCLKTLISVGIVITLLLGILLLYVLIYAFLISSVTAQILPDFRNGFIATFMVTSVLMILSSLSGIYGLIRKRNKFVIAYSITMLIYFIVFIVLAAFLIKYPTILKQSCTNPTPTQNYFQQTVNMANETLCKGSCECYFYNIGAYNLTERRILEKMDFSNFSDSDNELPVNAENCAIWDNSSYLTTNSLIFLESVFNCSGWCEVDPQYNLYFLFTDVNSGKPSLTCIQSLLSFFQKFGNIMQIACISVGFILFLILLTILCLCCHPDRGQEYDAMKFFKSTLMVSLNEESQASSKREIRSTSI